MILVPRGDDCLGMTFNAILCTLYAQYNETHQKRFQHLIENLDRTKFCKQTQQFWYCRGWKNLNPVEMSLTLKTFKWNKSLIAVGTVMNICQLFAWRYNDEREKKREKKRERKREKERERRTKMNIKHKS